MKNATFLIIGSLVLTAVVLVGFSAKGKISTYHVTDAVLNTGGSPSGRTGAPGEATCTSCHSGSVLDGNGGVNALQLVAGGNEYLPNETNAMQLTFNDASNKNGFQLVVLNDAEEMAGSLIVSDAVNTKFVTSAFLNREYITHTSTGTTQSTWNFDWLAPASGGDVTFYVATNKTNAGSTNSGDVVYVSEHNFTAPDVAGIIEEDKNNQELIVGYQSSTNQLFLEFDVVSLNELSLNVTDLSGKSVFFQNMGTYTPGSYSDKVVLNTLDAGIYNITLFMNNKPYTGKVFVQ